MLGRLSKKLSLDKAAHFLVRKHPKWSIVSLAIVFILIIVLGYVFKWDWTGLIDHVGPNVQQYQPTKTLWDWMSVLCIPVAIAFGSLWFTAQQSKTQDAQNEDNQRERALQEYIDKISDLMLQHHLDDETNPNKKVGTIARARTLIVLASLDNKRKGSVLQFLYESGLIQGSNPIISLKEADFSKAYLPLTNLSSTDLSNTNLRGAYLGGTDLHFANLSGAILSGVCLGGANLVSVNFSSAYLDGTDLSSAVLSGANFDRARLYNVNLSGAYLDDTDLSSAVLSGADLTQTIHMEPEQLARTKSLEGTIMPDGSSIEKPGDPSSFASQVLTLRKQHRR